MPNTAQETTHRLIIHSLDDGSLACACGRWTCVHTGRMNHQDAESEYQAHLLRVMTLADAVRLGLIHATAEQVGNQHGYLCPKCKSGEHIRIAAIVWADLLPEGTDNSDSDTEWDDASSAQCTDYQCLWCGKVSDLITVEVSE